MGQIEERLGELAKLIQSEKDAAALRTHVEHLLESPSFSTSRRSGQFLHYVIEKAIAQQTDALKERTIGVAVFHRPPNYDTGEDAIVRVTASDVRRRLAQHYNREGRTSEFKISLPPGGYVPEVFREESPAWTGPVPSEDVAAPEMATPSLPAISPAPTVDSAAKPAASGRLLGVIAAVASVVVMGLLFFGSERSAAVPVRQPWSLLFHSGKPLFVVTADPDLNEIQLLTGRYVPLSDYANGKLGCETLAPVLQGVCRDSLRGDKVASVDASALAKIASLAAQFHSSLDPHAARGVRLTDLQTEGNYLLLGSRTANPWTDLFRDKVDFYVSHDDRTGLQVVHNVHPRPGELPVYVPTAGPYGTGDNYTLVSFLRSLNGTGYALLLAGGTHEGMDAATAVALDPQQLDPILRDCGVRSGEPFQILLKLRMMAGSSLQVSPVACHKLPSA